MLGERHRKLDIDEPAALRGAAAGGHLLRCRSSTMSPHRLRRGALHLPARRSRQNVNLFLREPLGISIPGYGRLQLRRFTMEAALSVLNEMETAGLVQRTAIGGALAGWAGASMICYVTPSEHLGLPTLPDVRQGVIAARIAAHAADIARGLPGARHRDDEMGRARRRFDWETQFRLALDPDTARTVRRNTGEVQDDDKCCSMCGPSLCAMRLDAELAEAMGETPE